MKRTRFFIGIALLVQAASFLMMFILLCRKKKSLSLAILTVALAGGISGIWLLYHEANPGWNRRPRPKSFAPDTSDEDESLFDEQYPDEVEICEDDGVN